MLELIGQLNSISEIINVWINKYFGDGLFLILTLLAYELLYTSCKELRKKFLLPIAVVMLIAWNPLLYKYIFYRIIYWRLMWMLPNVILIAMAVTILIKKQNAMGMKLCCLTIIVWFIVTCDTNVFVNGRFSEVSNWEKISSETIQISDAVKEIDADPKVIVPMARAIDMRQYAPEISMLYGRTGNNNHIRWEKSDIIAVFRQVDSDEPDYDYVLTKAVEYNVNFVVVEHWKPISDELLAVYGYKQVDVTPGHIIYYNEEI